MLCGLIAEIILYLSNYYRPIPNITDYHHFCFDGKSPGVVFVRVLADDKEQKVRISPNSISFNGLPSEVVPSEMFLARQGYLYNDHFAHQLRWLAHMLTTS